MKMLCIRGQQRPHWHTGVKAGHVYEVSYIQAHCTCTNNGTRAAAQGSVFHRPVKLTCKFCRKSAVYTVVPWGKDRFIPWSPDVLTQEDYQDNPYLKEKEKEKEKSDA